MPRTDPCALHGSLRPARVPVPSLPPATPRTGQHSKYPQPSTRHASDRPRVIASRPNRRAHGQRLKFATLCGHSVRIEPLAFVSRPGGHREATSVRLTAESHEWRAEWTHKMRSSAVNGGCVSALRSSGLTRSSHPCYPPRQPLSTLRPRCRPIHAARLTCSPRGRWIDTVCSAAARAWGSSCTSSCRCIT